MSVLIQYLLNKASTAEIAQHLTRCDADFLPALSCRVEINDYAEKIASKATRFEAWSGGTLVGLVAAYCNDKRNRVAFLTSVSVLRAWTGKGIGAHLVDECVKYAKASGMRQISLEVGLYNTNAIKLYKKSGFITGKAKVSFITMDLRLESEKAHEQTA